jgi:hypothetical protein
MQSPGSVNDHDYVAKATRRFIVKSTTYSLYEQMYFSIDNFVICLSFFMIPKCYKQSNKHLQ